MKLENVKIVIDGEKIPYEIVRFLNPCWLSFLPYFGAEPIRVGRLYLSIPKEHITSRIDMKEFLNLNAEVKYDLFEWGNTGKNSVIRTATLGNNVLSMRFLEGESGTYSLEAATLFNEKEGSVDFFDVSEYNNTKFYFSKEKGISFSSPDFVEIEGIGSVPKEDLPFLSDSPLAPEKFRAPIRGLYSGNFEVPQHLYICSGVAQIERYKLVCTHVIGSNIGTYYCVLKQTSLFENIYRLVSMSKVIDTSVIYLDVSSLLIFYEQKPKGNLFVKLRSYDNDIEFEDEDVLHEDTINKFKSLKTNEERRAFIEGMRSVDETYAIQLIKLYELGYV